MTNTKDEALKMAIDFLDGSYEAHKVRKACQEALEQPAQEPEYVYINPVTNDMYYLTKTEQPEPRMFLDLSNSNGNHPVEQPSQEPVAWMHYKTFDLIYHDVWEELLEGKDEWYPLDYQENTNLRQVVKNHIEDLRKCIPVLNEYPQMKQTMVEVEKAISELQEALYTHPAPLQNEFAKTKSWQGLSNDKIREIGDNCLEKNNGLFNWIDFARAIEQALKEKNHG